MYERTNEQERDTYVCMRERKRERVSKNERMREREKMRGRASDE